MIEPGRDGFSASADGQLSDAERFRLAAEKKQQLAVAIQTLERASAVERETAIAVLASVLKSWDEEIHGPIPENMVADLERHSIDIRDYLGIDGVEEVGGEPQQEGVAVIPEEAVPEAEEPVESESGAETPIESSTRIIKEWNQDYRGIDSMELDELLELREEAAAIDALLIDLHVDLFDSPEIAVVERNMSTWKLVNGRRNDLEKAILRKREQLTADEVEASIATLEQLLTNEDFRPTEPEATLNGRTALEEVSDVRQRLDKLTDVSESLLGRLGVVEQSLAKRVFEQWGDGLETNHFILVKLADITQQAVDSASSASPDFSLIQRLEDVLSEARDEVLHSVSGDIYEDYLLNNYWRPAEEAQSLLEQKKKEAEQKQQEQKVEEEKMRDFERLFGEIESEIGKLETRGYFRIQVFTNNPLKNEMNRLRERFRDLRVKGVEEERVEALFQEYIRVCFVVLKATIIKSIESYEFNDDGAGLVDTKNRDLFEPLMDDLKSLIAESTADKREMFAQEYERFSEEVGARIVFYLAARSIKNDVLGITDSAVSDEIAMQIPSSIPIYMNNLTNALIQKLLSGEVEPCREPELVSPHIETYNQVIETRRARYFDANSQRYIEEDVEITAWGQALRHLDMFFEGRSPSGVGPALRRRFAQQRREVYLMSGEDIFDVVEAFEKARLEELYQEDRLRAQQDGLTPPQREDERYQSKISKKDAIRAWNFSMLLMSPLALAPSSFNKPAPGYYALSPDYAMGEIAGSESGATSDISALIYFSIIGPSYPHLADQSNPDGLIHTFDAYENRDANGGGVIDRIARKTHPSNIRGRMREALRNKGYGDSYDFLVDLPLLPIFPNGLSRNSKTDSGEHLRYHVFTTPLSNMALRNERGLAIHHPDETGHPNPDYAIMTLDDMVDHRTISPDNPNGSRLYEAMPFEHSHPEDEELNAWVGQSKNAREFFSKILFATEPEFAQGAARTMAAKNNKLVKYATNVLQPYALLLREGVVDREKLKNQITLTILLIQGILMIAQGQSIEEVKQSFFKFAVGSKEGREAVITCIEAGFSTAALARNFTKQFADQVVQSMRLD